MSQLKFSQTIKSLNSYQECLDLQPFNKFITQYKKLEVFYYSAYLRQHKSLILANCVLYDMTHLMKMWRHIRGYPVHGSTTHTNAKSARKNKLLLNFRVNQFFLLYGKKSRDIYPTLIKAEYNNRLWKLNWLYEYSQSYFFALYMAAKGHKTGIFNPALLASNQVNGFVREGNAAKLGKAKKLTKVFTLGVPLLFANYIFLEKNLREFPKIILHAEANKQLGKKLRRRQYK